MDEDGVGGSGLREDQLVTSDEIDAVIREVRPLLCAVPCARAREACRDTSCVKVGRGTSARRSQPS
jgi:hypothetical protein